MSSTDAALICKALGDSNRLQIVQMLSAGEKCACNLLEQFDITQPTLSHHMRILCECGLVEVRKAGKWSHYLLNEETLSMFQSFNWQFKCLQGWCMLMLVVWDIIQNQVLGMKWLNNIIGSTLTAMGLDISKRVGGSVQFFIYDVVKITILLCCLIFMISYIQSYFPPERSKKNYGSFSWNWSQYHGGSFGHSNSVLLLFVHTIVYWIYRCGAAIRCYLLIFDFLTNGGFREFNFVNKYIWCKSCDCICYGRFNCSGYRWHNH